MGSVFNVGSWAASSSLLSYRKCVVNPQCCAGISSVQSSGLLDRITGAWDNPAKPLAREGAVLAFAALVKQLGEAGEPYLLPLVPKLLERYADKVRGVHVALSMTIDAPSLCASSSARTACPDVAPHMQCPC